MHKSPSRLVVADVDTAERVTIELVRNILVAYPNANVFAAGVARWPKLNAFLTNEAFRFGMQTDHVKGYWDVYIVGDDSEYVADGVVGMVIALPNTRDAIIAESRVDLDLGTPAGEVVVVPGTARVINGSHLLTAETCGRVRRAERIAERRPVRALILSGWNGRVEGSQSEAAQMLVAWHGPQIPIILDEAARTTAENALWAASLATALGGVRRIRMVTSWVSALRLGLATFAAFRKTSVQPRLSIVWGRNQAASWRPAFGGLVHLRRHLRVGRAILSSGPDSPSAQL
jgi:hypothetical protein